MNNLWSNNLLGKKNAGIKPLMYLNIDKINRNPIMIFRGVFRFVVNEQTIHIACPPIDG